MSATEAQPSSDPPFEVAPNPRGEALFAELLWVHRMIRGDLATVRRLAGEVLAGLPAEQVRAGVAALATSGPLWSLRMNCLYYCRFEHAHHDGESHLLFPAVRASHPELAAVVDRLEADHVAVARLLDEIEAAADGLVGRGTTGGGTTGGGTAGSTAGSTSDGTAGDDGGDAAARRRVVDALTALADRLLVHLDYEEEQLGPVLRTWDGWPFG